MDGCGAQQDPRMLFGAKVPTEGGRGRGNALKGR